MLCFNVTSLTRQSLGNSRENVYIQLKHLREIIYHNLYIYFSCISKGLSMTLIYTTTIFSGAIRILKDKKKREIGICDSFVGFLGSIAFRS